MLVRRRRDAASAAGRTNRILAVQAVKDHGGRALETLADVRSLMMSLPERHLQDGHRVYAGQLLLAAATDEGVSMHDVQQQFAIALKAEGLI
jgi:hypothetical protein